MVYVYQFEGLIPSKKNSRVTVKATGRSFPSKKYAAWHKAAGTALVSQARPSVPITSCVIDIQLRFGTLGVADMTNKVESLMDLLVDLYILQDDNWKVVPDMRLRACLDRDNPGATVTISENYQLI